MWLWCDLSWWYIEITVIFAVTGNGSRGIAQGNNPLRPQVSWPKTKIQVFGDLLNETVQSVHACSEDIEILENFTYLGRLVHNDGRSSLCSSPCLAPYFSIPYVHSLSLLPSKVCQLCLSRKFILLSLHWIHTLTLEVFNFFLNNLIKACLCLYRLPFKIISSIFFLSLTTICACQNSPLKW